MKYENEKTVTLEHSLTAKNVSRLTETFSMQVVSTTLDHTALFEQLQSPWSNSPYAPLTVLLSALIAVGRIHHTHHWQSHSDSFYGDHLMFQRLYEAIQDEVDSLGERTIGLGSIELVNPILQAQQVARVVTSFTAGMPLAIPNVNDLVNGSYVAEMHFAKFMELCTQRLGEYLSYGTDNLLAGIADTHESHVYLLKQRITR